MLCQSHSAKAVPSAGRGGTGSGRGSRAPWPRGSGPGAAPPQTRTPARGSASGRVWPPGRAGPSAPWPRRRCPACRPRGARSRAGLRDQSSAPLPSRAPGRRAERAGCALRAAAACAPVCARELGNALHACERQQRCAQHKQFRQDCVAACRHIRALQHSGLAWALKRSAEHTRRNAGMRITMLATFQWAAPGRSWKRCPLPRAHSFCTSVPFRSKSRSWRGCGGAESATVPGTLSTTLPSSSALSAAPSCPDERSAADCTRAESSEAAANTSMALHRPPRPGTAARPCAVNSLWCGRGAAWTWLGASGSPCCFPGPLQLLFWALGGDLRDLTLQGGGLCTAELNLHLSETGSGYGKHTSTLVLQNQCQAPTHRGVGCPTHP